MVLIVHVYINLGTRLLSLQHLARENVLLEGRTFDYGMTLFVHEFSSSSPFYYQLEEAKILRVRALSLFSSKKRCCARSALHVVVPSLVLELLTSGSYIIMQISEGFALHKYRKAQKRPLVAVSPFPPLTNQYAHHFGKQNGLITLRLSIPVSIGTNYTTVARQH